MLSFCANNDLWNVGTELILQEEVEIIMVMKLLIDKNNEADEEKGIIKIEKIGFTEKSSF